MSTTTTARITGTASTTLDMTVVDCPSCGVIFGLDDSYVSRRVADGKSFYCPSGHQMSYGKSEADKLKEQLKHKDELIRVERDNADFWRGRQKSTAASLRSTKAAHTRTKKRAAAGLCPCCRRSFQNVQRHVESQHPDFAADATS